MWSKQLETWFQTVDVRAWVVLIRDDDADWHCLDVLENWLCLSRTLVDTTPAEEVHMSSPERHDGARAYNSILDRITERYRRLFALLYVRDCWLKAHQKRSPERSVKDILDAAPVGATDVSPSARKGSLWPLPTAAPSSLTLVTNANVSLHAVPFCPVAAYVSSYSSV
ncbi:hypothetical protein JCM6882_007807 [Rhodosporidiobolus microsporus]